jgi:hypothetical protein
VLSRRYLSHLHFVTHEGDLQQWHFVTQKGDLPQLHFVTQEVYFPHWHFAIRSAELLKKELEKQGKSSSREYLYKVNMAMAVLYARQVLRKLLAHWPESAPAITADLLGCKEVHDIPCILFDFVVFFNKGTNKLIYSRI